MTARDKRQPDAPEAMGLGAFVFGTCHDTVPKWRQQQTERSNSQEVAAFDRSR
jgi:hypothetical protein